MPDILLKVVLIIIAIISPLRTEQTVLSLFLQCVDVLHLCCLVDHFVNYDACIPHITP